jgi:putative iron-regulated protein
LVRYGALFESYPRLPERLDRPAGRLSGGEKKLVGFARTLADEAPVTLLNEPSEGMQPENLARMAACIQQRRRAGAAFAIVEQNLNSLLPLLQQVLVPDHGELLRGGPAGPDDRAALLACLRVKRPGSHLYCESFASDVMRTAMHRSLSLPVLLVSLTVFAGPLRAATITPASVATHYATLVHSNYADALAATRQLQTSVAALTASPSADTLTAARRAWLAAREFYGQTEAFRFYGGPIDDAKGLEGRINAWPMDESFVDGLINKRKFTISKKAIAGQNERGGEENIATGWHSIEFLLWGPDRSTSGPGERSADDFVDGKAPNADRRRQYLAVATELLIDDLGSLVTAWAPAQKANYRARFEKSGNEALRRMLVGLGSLSRGELAGERLEVALASQDQEDEHSCFSDNTHRDAVTDAQGIENVWLGRYRRADGSVLQGPSLRDLVAAKNAALADKTTARIRQSVQAAEAIPAPFDRAIVGGPDAPGRQRIQATVASLTQQSQDLVEAAAAIGITKLTLVQP